MSSINSRVPPLRLMAVDTPTDGQIAAYQASSGKFEWVANSGGGSFTSFTVAGDAGASQTITDGNTLTLQGSGGITKVTMSATDTATFSLENTAVTPGSYTYASITVDAQGRLTAASSGTAPASGANPTATVSGSATNGSASTFMRSDAAPALANTTVTPGSYTYSSITVDAQGRLTAASSGTPPAVDGSGAATQVTYWADADTITGSSNFTFDGTNLKVAGYVESGTGVFDTDGATDLTLQTNGGTNSGTIVIRDGAAQDIEITPNGAGVINLDGLKWPTADGSANQVLKTDGAGTLSFTDAGGGGSGDKNFISGAIKDFSTATNQAYSLFWPFYPVAQYAQPTASTAGSLATYTVGYPFVAQSTGNIAGLNVRCTTAGTDAFHVAIYETDNDLWPSTLVGLAKVDCSTTGAKRSTTFYETDGSTTTNISLTTGNVYWVLYGNISGDASVPTLGSPLNSTYHLSTLGTSGYANGGGYNQRGTMRFRIGAAQGTTTTDVFPTNYPNYTTINSATWYNSSNYATPIWIGVG